MTHVIPTEILLVYRNFQKRIGARLNWFLMYFLLFIRVLPAFSIAEIKETLPAPMRRKS